MRGEERSHCFLLAMDRKEERSHCFLLAMDRRKSHCFLLAMDKEREINTMVTDGGSRGIISFDR